VVLAVLAIHRQPSVESCIDRFLSDLRFCFFEISDKVSTYFVGLRHNLSQDVGDKIFDLQCENIRLKLQADRVDSVILENERLKSLLKMKESSKEQIIVAKIINIFNNDFVRSALINVGKKQNVQLDDFAYNEHGIIGRVIEVSDNWSKVLFIIDANSNIPAKISGMNAILSGDNSNLLKINLLNEGIKEGDIAESSSYGRVFREKITIGKVIKKNDKFFVQPSVNFNDLKYICIGKCQD
jgi:rod shape-determining protein MreC